MFQIEKLTDYNLKSPKDLKEIEQLEPEFKFMARVVAMNQRKETMAILFEMLLEKDRAIYKRKFDDVINPYK